MSKWHLIQNQPLLREIFREPPIVSYKKGKSLQDILVRAKLEREVNNNNSSLFMPRAFESCLACHHFNLIRSRSEGQEFGVRFFNLEWYFWIRSEVQEFGVSFSNLECTFWIRSEVQEFRVRFLNSEWGFWIQSEYFWIQSDVFEFGVRFKISEWGFQIRSEVQEFGVGFRIRSVIWHSQCTRGPL